MLVVDLDLFFHNRKTILCPSPSPCPYYCEYPEQSVAYHFFQVSQVNLLFGDFIYVQFDSSKVYFFQTDQLFIFEHGPR